MADLTVAVMELTSALFPSRPFPAFTIDSVYYPALKEAHLRSFLEGRTVPYLGVSVLFQTQRRLSGIVFATPTKVLHVMGLCEGKPAQAQLLQQYLCCNPDFKLFGADMDVIAYGLYTDAGVLVANGVDLQSLTPRNDSMSRDAVQIYYETFGVANTTKKSPIPRIFCDIYSSDLAVAKAVVRAREFAAVSQRADLTNLLARAAVISTKGMQPWVLQVAASAHRITRRLDAAKPGITKHDVNKEVNPGKDGLQLTCERYKTRVRGTGKLEIVADNGAKLVGTIREVKGRTVQVSLSCSLPARLKSVASVGKEPLPQVDQRKEVLLLRLLKGQVSPCLSENRVFSTIWNSGSQSVGTSTPSLSSVTATGLTGIELNNSQRSAVRAVMREVPDGQVDVNIIVGPPGTGKTTMIAASVVGLRSEGRPVWLMAHSNVAVKNIAQKLADVGFWNFKLIVSEEFHFDWHEHLYLKIEENVIRSDKLKGSQLVCERILGGAQVILCTLGTLSGCCHRLSTVVPVETIIVDEASQIELSEYLVPVNLYRRTLKKLVFVGDDKQLAPYGQDEIGSMQSIFEVAHHRSRAIMLDTSYRLPHTICKFISARVYSNKLHSVHSVMTREACKFVDVSTGVEKKSGNSWLNEAEANACISLARHLERAGKDFRIITPYDTQRVLIERKLKESEVPWQDRVFCVDSFQGNEAPYIIVSVVRTDRPGFLKNIRRTNVMLTRCTRGMYVCSKKTFLSRKTARDTLVGEMAAEWGNKGWISLKDVLNGRI